MEADSAASPGDREGLINRALRLAWLTVLWLLIEAVAAIWSGIAAHRLSLAQ